MLFRRSLGCQRCRLANSKTKLQVISVALIVVLLNSITACRSSPSSNSVALANNSLNEQGVRFATNGLVEDLLMGASGVGESALDQQQALALAKIDLAINARTFESDYEANELAGDSKYKNKRFLLSGTIMSIEKDFTGKGYLTLASANIIGVHAQLNDQGMEGAMSLKKGMKIFLVCQSSDRLVGTEVAGNCQRLSQYVDDMKPELNRSVRDFLDGKRALPRKLALSVLTLYLTGPHLKQGSTCLERVDERCEQEAKGVLDNPALMNQIKVEAEKLKPTLKFE